MNKITLTPLIKRQIPKHREVANSLQKEIRAGAWKTDERLPGELDLAKRYQVAHMTIRQAVSNLVEDGVLIRVRGKGTFVVPPDSRPSDRVAQHPMALIFPTDAEARDPYYFPEVLQGFRNVLAERGLSASIHGDIADLSARALDAGAAVAFLLFTDSQVSQIEKLRDNGYRVLAINRYTGRRSIPCVRIDDGSGVASAVDHLAKLGHERIGFVCGLPGNFDAVDRLRGFREAAKRHNLRSAPEAGDSFNEASGYAAARQLLALNHRPTAIVCASDLSALGVIKAARDVGISVPRGLSVIGFGDFSVADYMLPGLTTVRQGRAALGRTAGEALIELASGTDVKDIVLSAELIIRESTAENVIARPMHVEASSNY